jgi:hypothetical protein
MRRWLNHAGAFVLISIGISLYSWDPDFPTPGAPTPAVLLLIVGLLWVGLAFNDPLRGRRHHRCDGSLRATPASGAGYRRHRSSRYPAARPFAAEGRTVLAMDVPAPFAGGSFARETLSTAIREAKENLCGARVWMWAVLSGIVLSLMSSDLLLTDAKPSLLEQSECLYVVTSLAIGLGLLVTGILAADSVAHAKERARGALLLGKVWGLIAAWLLIFVISVPYILVVGFGPSVPWTALTYTFVLGSLCVAGFATLIVGISALSRSGRGVRLASVAIFVAMTAPTLLGAALERSPFGALYNALSPFAQVRLALDGVIADKESLLVQLPHLAALAAFATIAAVVAVFAVRGIPLEGGMSGMRTRLPTGS